MSEHDQTKITICKALGLDPMRIRSLQLCLDAGPEPPHVLVEYFVQDAEAFASSTIDYELHPIPGTEAQQ